MRTKDLRMQYFRHTGLGGAALKGFVPMLGLLALSFLLRRKSKKGVFLR